MIHGANVATGKMFRSIVRTNVELNGVHKRIPRAAYHHLKESRIICSADLSRDRSPTLPIATLERHRDSRCADRLPRCIVPVDGFFEWKRSKAKGRSSPMQSQRRTVHHSPRRYMGELERPGFRRMDSDFAIITTDANELVADIHDRMPVIVLPSDYGRWFGDEPDPRDLMRPFPADLMG